MTVWEIGTARYSGKMVTLLQSSDKGYTLERKEYPIHAGKIKIILPATSATILKFEDD